MTACDWRWQVFRRRWNPTGVSRRQSHYRGQEEGTDDCVWVDARYNWRLASSITNSFSKTLLLTSLWLELRVVLYSVTSDVLFKSKNYRHSASLITGSASGTLQLTSRFLDHWVVLWNVTTDISLPWSFSKTLLMTSRFFDYCVGL